MNPRALLAVLAFTLLALSTQVHVTIWLAGCPVARPPVAGLLLAAISLSCVGGLALVAWRLRREFRHLLYLKTA